MREIPLTRGKKALVDDADYDYLSAWKWCATPSTRTFYAFRRQNKMGVWMHRFLLGVTDPNVHVDHVNRNGLDNQRCNLRLADPSRNHMNATKIGGHPHTSKYKGVCWDSVRGKWKLQIKIHGQHIRQTRYDNEEEAARAYDELASKHFGEFAHLNFPPP